MNRLLVTSLISLLFCFGTALNAQDKITFVDHVAPIFTKRCATCHNSGKRSGDLDVTNFTNLMQGGSSGDVIEPGDPSNSYLYSLITHEDSPEMPPSGKIPDAEIALVAKWIEGGALETKASKAMLAKPKFDMAMSGSATVRPETPPLSARLPLQPTIVTQTPGTITTIATSPWAPLTAVAAAKQVLLFDSNSTELKGVIPTTGKANVLRFSRSGDILLITDGLEGGGAKIKLWDVRQGQELLSLANEADTILAADISPDHSMVAVGGPSKLVRVYSTADSSLLYEIKKHTDWVTSLEFSPDGQFLASGDRNGGLHVWYADAGAEHLTLKAHTKMISASSWRWDGKVLASGSEDGSIRLWEVEEGKQVKNWGGHGGGVTSLEFTRDGKIVSCGRDKVSRFWQQDGKRLAQYAGLKDVATAVSFCDESSRIFTADWTGLINVHQTADGKLAGTLNANPPKLEARIATANQNVTQLQAAYQPLDAKAKTLATGLAAAQTNQAAARKTVDQLKTATIETQTKVAGTQQQLTAIQNQEVAWQQELDAKNAVIPTVQNAKIAADKAVAALTTDPELKGVAEKLNTKLAQLTGKATELTQLIGNSNEKKKVTLQTLQSLQASLAESQGKLKQAEQGLAQLDKQVGELTNQLNTAKTAANAAKANLDNAAAKLTYWQNELNFVNQLAQLNTQLATATEAFVAKATVAEAQAAKLKQIQAEVEQATQVREQAKGAMVSIEEKIRQLKQVK